MMTTGIPHLSVCVCVYMCVCAWKNKTDYRQMVDRWGDNNKDRQMDFCTTSKAGRHADMQTDRQACKQTMHK